MDIEDVFGCGGHAVSVVAAGVELAYGAASGFLHGDAVEFGASAECVLFVVGESQGHGHGLMVSK